MWQEPLVVAGRSFQSRLILGSGDYPSFDLMRRCHEAAGTELVMVAVRRVDLSRAGESLLDFVDLGRITLLASTSGCQTAEEAVRIALLAREAGLGDLVKLEVMGDRATRAPDVAAVLEATTTLVREGFVVLPQTTDDPVAARRLADGGAAAVLVLGAPIGSGLGVRNAFGLRSLVEAVTVPVILAGGVGTASDAGLAMELGCQGVAVGTAVAGARDPEAMAEAMKLAVQAGWLAARAGRIPRRLSADAAAPLEGLPDWAPLR